MDEPQTKKSKAKNSHRKSKNRLRIKLSMGNEPDAKTGNQVKPFDLHKRRKTHSIAMFYKNRNIGQKPMEDSM